MGSRLLLSFSLMKGQEEDLNSVEVLQALIPPLMREFCCAAIPHAGEVTERMDLFDEATKTLGYTVLQGDSRYQHFSATMKFAPGAAAGTTDATWTATYVPVGDMGPPEHIKQIAILVFKALASGAKAKPTVA